MCSSFSNLRHPLSILYKISRYPRTRQQNAFWSMVEDFRVKGERCMIAILSKPEAYFIDLSIDESCFK